MTRFHDFPNHRMEEQICGMVEPPTSCAGDSSACREIKHPSKIGVICTYRPNEKRKLISETINHKVATALR